jgi:UDP-N-acetylglucosamine 2-epimerase
VLLDSVTKKDILEKYNQLKKREVKWFNPFGDGLSGQRIINIICKNE